MTGTIKKNRWGRTVFLTLENGGKIKLNPECVSLVQAAPEEYSSDSSTSSSSSDDSDDGKTNINIFVAVETV